MAIAPALAAAGVVRCAASASTQQLKGVSTQLKGASAQLKGRVCRRSTGTACGLAEHNRSAQRNVFGPRSGQG
jgi:hypothetical protein